MAGGSTIQVYNPPSVNTTQVPTTGVNSITSLGNSINSTLGNLVGSIPVVPQYFFTVPFPNNQPVLYKLRITQGGAAPASTATTGTLIDDFIFPLTPSSINKQSMNLTSFYDVRDSSVNQANQQVLNTGVQRIIDQYGQTPPIISIAGTTGFQFHSLDGYQWSGKSSFARLIQFIAFYINLFTQAINSNQATNLPQLQFFDGYTGEIFIVVPFGPIVAAMEANKPIIQNYNIQFLVQSTLTSATIAPLSTQDPIIQFFINTKALLTAGVISWWNFLLENIPGSNTIE